MSEYSNDDTTVAPGADTRRIRRWAYLRIFLGGVQMGGALASFGLICQMGVTVPAVGAVVFTGIATLVSLALFRWPGYAKKWTRI
jgi:hypothetical protein